MFMWWWLYFVPFTMMNFHEAYILCQLIFLIYPDVSSNAMVLLLYYSVIWWTYTNGRSFLIPQFKYSLHPASNKPMSCFVFALLRVPLIFPYSSLYFLQYWMLSFVIVSCITIYSFFINGRKVWNGKVIVHRQWNVLRMSEYFQ